MFYLAANILFGSGFGLIMKWVENRKIEDITTVGMISYIVSMFVFLPELFPVSTEAWTVPAVATGAANGFSYFVAFFFCVYAIRFIGVANATVVGSLSMLAPILAGILIWSEHPNLFQIVGIGLALFALTLIGRKGDAIDQGKVVDKPAFTPVVVAVFFGLCALSRLAQETFKHMCDESVERPVYLFSAFLVAAIPSTVVLIYRRKPVQVVEAFFGVALGIANSVQIHFLLKALSQFDGFIVFPLVSAGALVLTTLVATFLMGERLGRMSYIGIAIACVSLVLLKGFDSYQ